MCITGNQAGQHCESVDLNPPADRKFFRFKKRLQTPEPTINTPGAYRISVSDLSIPQAARLELARSEEAELHANPEQALRHLERALAIFPNFASALNNMGVHYYRIHDFAKSVQYLRKATEADPDSYAAWSNLGSSILSTGKFKEALEANQRANALRPDDARTNSQLALNHYYLHDYARAMDYFEKTLALDPQSATYPQLFLAQIAIIRKQQEEAERYIRDFLRLHPNSPQAARLKEVLDQVAVQHFVSLPAIDLTTGP